MFRAVRFFLDRDVPVEVARVLRHEGYEVTELREVLAVRASDVEVLPKGVSQRVSQQFLTEFWSTP